MGLNGCDAAEAGIRQRLLAGSSIAEVGQPSLVAARFVPFAVIWRINGNRQPGSNGCQRQHLIADLH